MKKMKEAATKIAHEMKEAHIAIDEAEYVNSFKTEMMDAVYNWCKGASFSEICKVAYDSLGPFYHATYQ